MSSTTEGGTVSRRRQCLVFFLLFPCLGLRGYARLQKSAEAAKERISNAVISFDLVEEGQRHDLRIFDGHGGLSAGGSSRLLIDYPEPQRSEILDYLFLPQFGASMAVLKLEIGGDTQSTVGTEPSHQHFRGDRNCLRGYEGWLAREAKLRNPNIIIWSLSWGVPGWIGNETNDAYFSNDNIEYQIDWLRCLRDFYNVTSSYIGLWNERPQGSVEYVIRLREELDRNGFRHVGITVEASWQRLIDNALDDPMFNASVAAATLHYPCNKTCPAAIEAKKKVWAGEDTPTPFQNWTAASCWGRKLNQHFLKLNMTSTVSWAVVWSAVEGVSVPAKIDETNHQFRGNAFLMADEPWSGNYKVPPAIWIMAHWGQFVQPGWRFLHDMHGSGFLAAGGSFITLVPSETEFRDQDTLQLSMILETLHGTCGNHPVACDVPAFSTVQNLTFSLSSSLHQDLHLPSHLRVWCSNSTDSFAQLESLPVDVTSSSFSIVMHPDTICTVTTLDTGRKGQYPEPPTSALFPNHHHTDFSTDKEDGLAWGFSDVYGSFAVKNQSLTQMATASPVGWAPVNNDPLTLFGDPHWERVRIRVFALVNHTADHHYVRVCGRCANLSDRRILFDCPALACFNVSWTGWWTFANFSGRIDDFEDDWHEISLDVSKNKLAVTVDENLVVTATPGAFTKGMVGLGCGSYHMCSFRKFSVHVQPFEALQENDAWFIQNNKTSLV